tara:strand:+ start:326 stop:583 length:258 start_codon:yes stop_codon:yes gene_type:complete
MTKLKINNTRLKALWESIPCICHKESIIESHPIINCEFCRCEIAWNSVPQKSWIVKDHKGKDKTIKEITLKRGKNEDVIGWEFSA